MSGQKWKSLIGGLNLQFIAYFLLFAYLPLLSFSIIGYHLNKRLIRQMHEQNIEILCKKTGRHLLDYFALKKEKIRQLYDIGHLKSQKDHLPEILSAALWEKDRLIPLKNISDSLAWKLKKKSDAGEILYFDAKNGQLFFNSSPAKKALVWAALPVNVIRRLLRSEDPHTKFCIKTNSGNTSITVEGEQVISNVKEKRSVFSILRNDENFEYRIPLVQNWTVTAVRSAQGVYGELEHFLMYIFVANIIIGLLMFAIAVFLARRIAGPIEELVVAANKFSEGDLSSPVAVKGSEEINILSREFEVMRRKLLESYSNLEEKIEERTEALRKAQFQISHQEKMASLGLLAAGVAHEIGNPLTGISSMAQIIKRRIKDPEIEDYISTILSNIDRISRIVRELVDFTRPSSYEAANVDPNEVIKSAVGIARYDKRAKNIDLQMNLDSDLPALFLVEDQLLQVFINILINAMDACSENTGRLKIRSFSKNGNVYIYFTDNGTGIPDEHLPKIFEPFFTTKKVGKGTGLGLSVSYGIIKNLNGRIIVKSRLNEGSTFIIEIPVNTAEQNDES